MDGGYEILRCYYRLGRFVEEVVETLPPGERYEAPLIWYIAPLFRPQRNDELPMDYFIEYYESFSDSPPNQFFTFRLQKARSRTNDQLQ